MAISSQLLQVLVGLETEFLASKNAELLLKSVSVSADGVSNGLNITESSGMFAFNAKQFTNVGTINLAASSTVTGIKDPVANTDAAPRKWVLDQIASSGASIDWKDSVLTRATTPPGTPATGTRYLIKATATDAWAGKENQLAEWNGTSWDYTVPTTGAWVAVNDEPTVVYNYSGAAWVAKYFETTTASGFLDLTAGAITLKNLLAGKLIVGDVSNIAQAVTPSGDLTMSNVGAFTIANSALAVGGRLAGGGGTKLSVSFTELGTASGAIAAGDLVAQTTAGVWFTCKADFATLGSLRIGVAAASIADTEQGLIYVHAGCKVAGFTGLTLGQHVIVSRVTAGAYVQSSTGYVAGEFLYSIGRAASGTEVEFAPVLLGKLV